VEARDVSLDHMTNCRVKIQGLPSSLHLSTMTKCTILSGPVSTSVFMDICTSSTLSISCQQKMTHRTANTPSHREDDKIERMSSGGSMQLGDQQQKATRNQMETEKSKYRRRNRLV
jgi:hypothetical protein